MNVLLDLCHARTEKYCEGCNRTIKEKAQFIRLGTYPNDKTFHQKCIKKYAEQIIKEVKKIE